jgi:putative addiction module killer protein
MYTLLTTAKFDGWFTQIKDTMTRLRIQVRIDRMASGHFGDVKSVGQGVSEARLDFGPGYRLYFTRQGLEVIVLLCGGDKATQARDIEAALAIATQLKEDKP